MIVLEITASVTVAGVFGIVAWIGFTIATTSPPKPVVGNRRISERRD